ncbi:MAG: hypothetical protein AB7F64_09115 [Gammaproteobacteria bacterium]
MNEYAGLNELTPLIIKYPFEKLFKAFFNIKLRKKMAKSLGTIIAFGLGVFVGFTFPGLGYFIVFMLNILFSIPVNSAVISGISMAVTMVLASSLFIYLNEKIFQSYNTTKYGFSNTDWIFTKKDRDLLQLIISDEDESLTPHQVKQNVLDIENRFKFLVEKIRIYKITRQNDKKETAKIALKCLRRADLSVFLDEFEDDFIKRTRRMENFKLSKLERRANSTLDLLSENPSEVQSPVIGRANSNSRSRATRPSLTVTDFDNVSEANSDKEEEVMSEAEQYKPQVNNLARSLKMDAAKTNHHKETMVKKPVISREIYTKNHRKKTEPMATGVRDSVRPRRTN